MSAEHVRTPGPVGLFLLDDPEVKRAFSGCMFVARDDRGYMYLIDVEPRPNEDGAYFEWLVSLRKMVEADDPRGPLVSRRRVNTFRMALDRAASEDGVTAAWDEDGRVTLPDGYDPSERIHALMNGGIVGDVILEACYEACAVVGVKRGGRTRTIALAGEQHGGRRHRTTSEVLDDVWPDDAWEATVDEVVSECQRAGYDVTVEAVKKALQRGPYEISREGVGRRPATWRRDLAKAARS